MLDNVGLRYPHRASGAKAPRTLRPLPLLRFAVSATGGAHLCSTKYYLRFLLSSLHFSLAASALRMMRYCLSSVRLFSGSACGRVRALPAPSRSANAQPARRSSHAPVIRLRNRFDRGYRLPGTCFAALLRAAMQNQFCLPCRGSASAPPMVTPVPGPVCVCRIASDKFKIHLSAGAA